MSYHGYLWELRYEHGTSSKFYRVTQIVSESESDYRVLFEWGRIGTRGQSKVETFSNAGAVNDISFAKLDEKRKKGYETSLQHELQSIPPHILKVAAVNARSQEQAQQAVDTNMVAAMMSKLDSAVRLATGTTEDQAQAVELARDVRVSLEDLREQVLQVETTVEVLDELIISQLTG